MSESQRKAGRVEIYSEVSKEAYNIRSEFYAVLHTADNFFVDLSDVH